MKTEPKETYRLFFAFDIDDALRVASKKIIKYLQKQKHGDHVKWIPPENLHVTLRFLGEVETNKIDQLIDEVKQAIQEIKSFSISVGNVIGFPPNHPHIISIMFTLSEELAKLVLAIEQAINHCGFEPEQRVFMPHLTLGRLRSSHMPEMETIPVKLPQRINVEEIILFRSELNENGSIYTPLKRIVFDT